MIRDTDICRDTITYSEWNCDLGVLGDTFRSDCQSHLNVNFHNYSVFLSFFFPVWWRRFWIWSHRDQWEKSTFYRPRARAVTERGMHSGSRWLRVKETSCPRCSRTFTTFLCSWFWCREIFACCYQTPSKRDYEMGKGQNLNTWISCLFFFHRLKRRWWEERRWSCYSVTPAIRYSHNQKTLRKYSVSTNQQH